MRDSDARVAVVGSANTDFVAHVSHQPVEGETLVAEWFETAPGGKGLNQAFASVQVAQTALVANVGDDSQGLDLVRQAKSAGIDVSHVTRAPVPTGQAFITVDRDANNSIVVVAGANAGLEVNSIIRALSDLKPTVLLCQLETPVDAVRACALWSQVTETRFVFNCSPARSIPNDIMEVADPLIVNEGEARAILELESSNSPAVDAAALVAGLGQRASSVVITAGQNGAWVYSERDVRHIPGIEARAVDTTGAGDAFAGTVAAYLGLGASLVDAVERANSVAAGVVAETRRNRHSGETLIRQTQGSS